MFNQEVLDKVGRVGMGIVMVLLPVTSFARCRSPVPHRITQPTENFKVVLLVTV
jgi:hypothetical protein